MSRMFLSFRVGRPMSQERLGEMVAEVLAQKPAHSGATVSRWETGDTTPAVETLRAVAIACGVDPGWLAFGKESQAPAPMV